MGERTVSFQVPKPNVVQFNFSEKKRTLKNISRIAVRELKEYRNDGRVAPITVNRRLMFNKDDDKCSHARCVGHVEMINRFKTSVLFQKQLFKQVKLSKQVIFFCSFYAHLHCTNAHAIARFSFISLTYLFLKACMTHDARSLCAN